MNEPHVWHVHSYPDGEILYTGCTYHEAEEWRAITDAIAFIAPEFVMQSATP